jgi:hypothetical protein
MSELGALGNLKRLNLSKLLKNLVSFSVYRQPSGSVSNQINAQSHGISLCFCSLILIKLNIKQKS